MSYRSAFADYKPWQEPEPSSWHAANESAAALGGHLGHLRGYIERAQGHAHATLAAGDQTRAGAMRAAGPPCERGEAQARSARPRAWMAADMPQLRHPRYSKEAAARPPGIAARSAVRGVHTSRYCRGGMALALVAGLGGCATFSPDGGMTDVHNLAQDRGQLLARALQRIGDTDAARAAVADLLKVPLTAESAVEPGPAHLGGAWSPRSVKSTPSLRPVASRRIRSRRRCNALARCRP